MANYDDIGRIPRQAFVVSATFDYYWKPKLMSTDLDDSSLRFVLSQCVCSILYSNCRSKGVCP